MTNPSAVAGGQWPAKASATAVITGGCGFLGVRLAQEISAEGIVLSDDSRLSAPFIQLCDLALWVASPHAAVDALYYAPVVPERDLPLFGAMNAPDNQITVQQMLDGLRECAGRAARDLVTHEPDERIMAIGVTWPRLFDVTLARSLESSQVKGLSDVLDQALRMK